MLDYLPKVYTLVVKQWVTLTHTSTYIHGPFDFASVRNRKTRDRISADDWTVLYNHRTMYKKPPSKIGYAHVFRPCGSECAYFLLLTSACCCYAGFGLNISIISTLSCSWTKGPRTLPPVSVTKCLVHYPPYFLFFFKNETQSVMTCLKGHGSRVTIDDCFRWENLR